MHEGALGPPFLVHSDPVVPPSCYGANSFVLLKMRVVPACAHPFGGPIGGSSMEFLLIQYEFCLQLVHRLGYRAGAAPLKRF